MLGFLTIIGAIIYIIWDGDQRNRLSSKRNRKVRKRLDELYKDMPDMQIK